MAARKWHAYVYELTYGHGVLYVGKGTGNRLKTQIASFGLEGREVAWFKSEKDAYQFERKLISEISPRLNSHPGGNGSWAKKRPEPRRLKWEIDMDRVGTRVYAARFLLETHWRHVIDPSKIEGIRRVAYAGG